MQDEIVEVLRTNAAGEAGFAFIRTGENIEGFVKTEYIKITKCVIHRSDEAESTMLRCCPEDSEHHSVWVKGEICVAPNEEIEVLRVNSAGEAGWAFVRTHENVEGYLRAAYVGSPSDSEEIRVLSNQKSNLTGDQSGIALDGQLSRRTSSRVAAAPPSSTLHQFFSKAPLKSKSGEENLSDNSKVSAVIKHREEDAIRRSSRVRAPTKFLVKEMSSPSLDKWLQKDESKLGEESDNGDDATGDAVVRDVAVDEERPLGDYMMKLRSCVCPSAQS